MHMSRLHRRTQLLLDSERYERLERLAKESGASVGSLIRDAIDVAFPAEPAEPDRMGALLLAAEPMPIGEWDEVKEDLMSLYERGASIDARA